MFSPQICLHDEKARYQKNGYWCRLLRRTRVSRYWGRLVSIRQILNNANKSNIAKDLDENILIELGNWVSEGHSEDSDTMKDWNEPIKDGLETVKFETKGKDYPWESAANFKSSVIFDAVRDFGDRANSEILRNSELVAINSEIKTSPEIEALSERISSHMNYQLNKEIPKWRKKQGKFFYTLSAMGAAVKKTFYDPNIGGINSDFITYPDFSVNNKCGDFSEVTRFTHIRKFTSNDIFTRVASGDWIEFEMPENEEEKDKGYYEFLEQYCEYDLDNDGYAEPYIVTVHKESNQVVRIAPRYSEQDVYIRHDGKTKRALDVAFNIEEQLSNNELLSESNIDGYFKEDLAKEYKKSKLVRIESENMLTLYNFVVPIDGTLLGNGFLHIMGNQAKGINRATNDLFNSATLSNLQFGFLSKEHRTTLKGAYKAAPAKWQVTNISADKLAGSVQQMPVKEPSSVLLQLNEQIKAETQALGTKTNIGDAISPNVPAISVLGMLQEGIIPTSALIGRMIEAMTDEFNVIAELNAKYTDPVLYKQITGDPNADYAFDYNEDTVDVSPTANAQFSSQFQRIQLAQVQMEQVPLLLQAQANPLPVIRQFFDAIGSDLTEEVFSNPDEKDQQALQQMQAMQQAQLQAQQQQNQIMQAQFQLAAREQELNHERQTLKQEKEIAELQAKIAKDQTESEIKLTKVEGDFALKLTELETKVGEQLDKEVQENMLVFDLETGQFS